MADGDYNLLLRPLASQRGYTKLNWSPDGEFGIGLEFRDDESVNQAVGPWWVQFRNGDITNSSDNSNTSKLFNNEDGGLPAVVTGVIGIDGVHGGYTESHPVFSIALDTVEFEVPGQSITQNWVYFLRTRGNGGGCSEAYYGWNNTVNNIYYIQLPWPEGASGVEVLSGTYWGWQAGDPPKSWILGSQEAGWTLIKIQMPNATYPGTDGQLMLKYTFPPGTKQMHHRAVGLVLQSKKITSMEKGKDDELDLDSIANRIGDAAIRSQFIADAKQVLKPAPRSASPAPTAEMKMNFTNPLSFESRPTVNEEQDTQLRTSPDLANKSIHVAVRKLSDKYRSNLRSDALTNK